MRMLAALYTHMDPKAVNLITQWRKKWATTQSIDDPKRGWPFLWQKTRRIRVQTLLIDKQPKGIVMTTSHMSPPNLAWQ